VDGVEEGTFGNELVDAGLLLHPRFYKVGFRGWGLGLVGGVALRNGVVLCRVAVLS
jgi:hypothetical protein